MGKMMLSIFVFAAGMLAANVVEYKALRVTTDKLVVREKPTSKSKALLTVTRGALLNKNGPSETNQKVETIAGVKGKWMDVGFGFVFGGLVESAEVMMVSVTGDCSIQDLAIVCDGGKSRYEFSHDTTLLGDWLTYDKNGCNPKRVRAFENAAGKRLHSALEEGDLAAVVETKATPYRVKQFLVGVRGRGGC